LRVESEGVAGLDLGNLLQELGIASPTAVILHRCMPIGPKCLWWLTVRLPVYWWEERIARCYQAQVSQDGAELMAWLESMPGAPLILRSGIRWGWDWKRSVAGEEENQ
jgi:hypothetical protein